MSVEILNIKEVARRFGEQAAKHISGDCPCAWGVDEEGNLFIIVAEEKRMLQLNRKAMVVPVPMDMAKKISEAEVLDAEEPCGMSLLIYMYKQDMLPDDAHIARTVAHDIWVGFEEQKRRVEEEHAKRRERVNEVMHAHREELEKIAREIAEVLDEPLLALQLGFSGSSFTGFELTLKILTHPIPAMAAEFEQQISEAGGDPEKLKEMLKERGVSGENIEIIDLSDLARKFGIEPDEE